MTLTGRGDLDDQRWLDQKIDQVEDGIEAVLDIARNWSELRNLSRLHPGVSAQDYILSRIKTPLGPGVIVPLLEESNWSNRQIAEIAGVSKDSVRRIATGAYEPVDRPAKTLGADGKLRPARVVKTITAEVIEPEGKKAPARKEVKYHKLLTVTEARMYAKGVEMNLAMLLPNEVVRGAIPVIREFLPRFDKWREVWDQSEN